MVPSCKCSSVITLCAFSSMQSGIVITFIQIYYLAGQQETIFENGIIVDNNVTENASVNLVSQTTSGLFQFNNCII